ncbi:MAG: YeeE/YedE family protein [Methanoregula sp.]|nr:YeeE/YedE family protein [Methanoregula sp.]
MFEFFAMRTWSPYSAGAGIGILSCFAFLLSDRPIGCSTAFVKARGMLGKVFDAERVKRSAYYREIIPNIDWQFMIIPGVSIGAFISVMLSGQFHLLFVPTVWGDAFGYNPAVRVAVALTGGILLGVGSRWAGGCTSGHGINGSIQLSLASMITAACFFAGGIAGAMLLFRVIGA